MDQLGKYLAEALKASMEHIPNELRKKCLVIGGAALQLLRQRPIVDMFSDDEPFMICLTEAGESWYCLSSFLFIGQQQFRATNEYY